MHDENIIDILNKIQHFETDLIILSNIELIDLSKLIKLGKLTITSPKIYGHLKYEFSKVDEDSINFVKSIDDGMNFFDITFFDPTIESNNTIESMFKAYHNLAEIREELKGYGRFYYKCDLMTTGWYGPKWLGPFIHNHIYHYPSSNFKIRFIDLNWDSGSFLTFIKMHATNANIEIYK